MRHLTIAAVFATALSALPAQVAPGTYAFTTLAGRAGFSGSTDGTGTNARFLGPWAVAVDANGNVYVAEAYNHTIRKITADGVVTAVAGQPGVPGSADGAGTAAQFGVLSTQTGGVATSPTGPFGLAVPPSGNLIVADGDNHTLRQITGNVVSLFAGSTGRATHQDGPVLDARFNVPFGVACDASGTMFVADCFNHVIRRISASGTVTTIAGTVGDAGFSDGIGTAARFFHPTAIAVDPNGNLYVIDCANAVRKISPGTAGNWETTTLAGTAKTYGSTDGTGAAARFGTAPPVSSSGVTVSTYFTLPPSAVASSGTIIVATNMGSFNLGEFRGLAADAAGNVYVTESLNQTIRKISPTGVVTTIGGSAGTAGSTDGAGSASRFNRASGIAVDSAGYLYIADTTNNTIRKGGVARAPIIRSQPETQTVGVGSSVSLAIAVDAWPNPTIQWTRNNVAISGATNATLTLSNVQTTQSGTYAATLSNSAGITSITPFTLTISAAPAITAQPTSQTVLGAQTVTLRVTAVASPAPTYQWQLNGVPVEGATNATLTLTNIQAEQAGDYRVVVTNANGTTTSNAATVTVNTGRLINLSIRTGLAGGDALIAGFVVQGGSKPLLVRAVGPALRTFGVGTAMADPQLTLQTGTAVLATNDNWSTAANAAQVATAAVNVGAFPLTANSLDSAVLATVTNSAVTAQTSARDNNGGVVLVELYDTGPVSTSRLVNVSTRTKVGVGENALFAGFVVGGNSPRTLLIRAIGPTLGSFGVTGVLADPLLEVFAAGATTARNSNDNWGGTTTLSTTFTSVGAFPLPSTTSRDAALVATFEPGTYSAKVSGVGNTTGEALLEIYELP